MTVIMHGLYGNNLVAWISDGLWSKYCLNYHLCFIDPMWQQVYFTTALLTWHLYKKNHHACKFLPQAFYIFRVAETVDRWHKESGLQQPWYWPYLVGNNLVSAPERLMNIISISTTSLICLAVHPFYEIHYTTWIYALKMFHAMSPHW